MSFVYSTDYYVAENLYFLSGNIKFLFLFLKNIITSSYVMKEMWW